jgi:hypothetical protein
VNFVALDDGRPGTMGPARRAAGLHPVRDEVIQRPVALRLNKARDRGTS